MTDWLSVHRGDAPLVISMPHTGTDIPRDIESGFVSPSLARKDTDWWVDQLYGFAADLGATLIRTRISRAVIDVNRDPSGASLYPGQVTTGLCPLETFDGEQLYRGGDQPGEQEVARRRELWFDPYHLSIERELRRLHSIHGKVVLYDAHSIRSEVPRLFEGLLPHFNIGTNNGATCSPALAAAIEAACDSSPFTRVTNGRFIGGWTTRHYGQPSAGIHAIQMELACRGYMSEPDVVTDANWPTSFDPEYAAELQAVLVNIIRNAITFAISSRREDQK